MLERSIHHSKWQTTNNQDGFMVISEVYYPAGWKIYINGVRTRIFPVNNILRGIAVPAGENNIIEMKFQPAIYGISVILSAIGLLTAVLITIFGIIVYYKQNYGKGIVYKIET